MKIVKTNMSFWIWKLIITKISYFKRNKLLWQWPQFDSYQNDLEKDITRGVQRKTLSQKQMRNQKKKFSISVFMKYYIQVDCNILVIDCRELWTVLHYHLTHMARVFIPLFLIILRSFSCHSGNLYYLDLLESNQQTSLVGDTLCRQHNLGELTRLDGVQVGSTIEMKNKSWNNCAYFSLGIGSRTFNLKC